MTHRTITSWSQFTFDNTYVPPVPRLSIEISGPNENNWLPVANAIIDTGADWTIVPEKILHNIDAYEWDLAGLRSQWGESRLVYRYEVDIRIESRTFPNVLVVSDEMGDEMIIGRNLLNWLRLLIDGLNQTIDLID